MASALLSAWGLPHPDFASIFAVSGAALRSDDLGTQYNGIGMSWMPIMADTITDIGFHQGTTTGTPAGGSYSVAIFPLTTGGLINSGATFGNAPSGGVTITTFTPSNANDNKWVWVSLGANTYSVTQAAEYGIAVWRNAATDASNKITANVGLQSWSVMGLPVAQVCAAGTWSKPATSIFSMMGLRSASAVYGYPFTGVTPFNANTTVGSTTEAGFTFTVPTNFCSTYKIRGVRGLYRSPGTSATNTFQANLYSSPTSSPAQIAKSTLIITDRFERTVGGVIWADMYLTSSPVLTAGVKYCLAFSTTNANDFGSYTLNAASAGDFDAWSYQENISYASRTASSFANIDAGTATGNFSETTTSRPWAQLLLEDLTAPSGGGVILSRVFTGF